MTCHNDEACVKHATGLMVLMMVQANYRIDAHKQSQIKLQTSRNSFGLKSSPATANCLLIQ